MKLVSAFTAAAVATFLFAGGANAAPVTSDALAGLTAASDLATPVACRVVRKRVCVSGRGCHSTSRRICTAPRHVCRVSRTRSCVVRHGRRICRTITRKVCH
jgi:hypothetical protein